MKHVHCWSVFEDLDDFPGTGPLSDRLAAEGLDGFELFTMVEPVPPRYRIPQVLGVHLPYAIDWRCAWEGRFYEDYPEDPVYFSFGRDREEMVATICRMVECASVLDPSYAVFHAGNTDMRQVLNRRHRSDDLRVIEEFCEMVNTAVARFPKGEPPVRLAFENLWWEGLKLRDVREYEVLERRLEFDNWGLVLDTGHLMNTCDDAYDEDSAIDVTLDIVSGYSEDMLDRICTMHLQLSASGGFRNGLKDESTEDMPMDVLMDKAYVRATAIDQHRPFTSVRVNEIVDAVHPEFVNHELMGGLSGDRFGDLRKQRSLFGGH